MKGYSYASVLAIIAVIAAFLSIGSIFGLEGAEFHILAGALGIVAIAVSLGAFGMVGELNMAVGGVVVVSLTHVFEVVAMLMGMSEYIIETGEHIFFYAGLILIMGGLWEFQKKYKFK